VYGTDLSGHNFSNVSFGVHSFDLVSCRVVCVMNGEYCWATPQCSFLNAAFTKLQLEQKCLEASVDIRDNLEMAMTTGILPERKRNCQCV